MGSADGHQGGAGASHQLHVRPAVEVFPHVVRLRPAPHSRTPIDAYSLQVEPAITSSTGSRTPSATSSPGWCSETGPQCDDHRGTDRRLEGGQPVRLLHRGTGQSASASNIRRRWPRTSSRTCGRSTRAARARTRGAHQGVGAELRRRPGTRTIDFLVALNRAINGDVGYSLRMEPGVQIPTTRCVRESGPVATRRGCWCRSCANSDWQRASCRATGAADLRTSRRSTARRGPPPTSPTSMRGRGVHPRCRLDRPRPDVGLFAGEGHIPLSATPHRIRPPRSPGRRSPARRHSSSPTSSPACTRTRG